MQAYFSGPEEASKVNYFRDFALNQQFDHKTVSKLIVSFMSPKFHQEKKTGIRRCPFLGCNKAREGMSWLTLHLRSHVSAIKSYLSFYLVVTANTHLQAMWGSVQNQITSETTLRRPREGDPNFGLLLTHALQTYFQEHISSWQTQEDPSFSKNYIYL
jgi:hypothetical protein